jgi:multicomponent Na+:H+ antiporter subunit B
MILAGFGVLLSGLAGLPSLVFGLPYMTHLWGEFPLPLTNLKVSTVMVFDFGIYCSVWGSLGGYSLTLLQLDEQEESRS